MAPKPDRKEKSSTNIKIAIKEPITPHGIATTSKKPPIPVLEINKPEPTCTRKLLKYLYNKQNKTVCDRTCRSWLYIIVYSIMYLIFLFTYSMIFLYGTLCILKAVKVYQYPEKIDLLTYSEHHIGLSATPTSVTGYPLIWYKTGEAKSYEKYISAIDKLLVNRRKTDADYTDLGPCGRPPYGYGNKPCIIVRINKRLQWAGKPLEANSTIVSAVPSEVKTWLRSNKKMLWLHCAGHHSYDKEHVRRIQYYPDPPGFDPNLFPLDVRNRSPMVALQISDFTPGVSLAVGCKLWYEHGPSSVEFVLYVDPQRSYTNKSNFNV